MAVIHVLDKHTAELIAAGEVVERPSSVVKELVENSIDAGSTAIAVEITHGGVESISVTDNGSGIEAEYIATAFIRHATSKIAHEEDLTAIGTLGFRGEALASIAAVARVDLLTRTADDEYACLYRQAGGQELSAAAAARSVGTTITVRDLFYNVPARMKFLKKDSSEGNYVADVVLKQALAHPEIAFRFVREGKEQFATPGDGELKSAIYAALTRDFAKNLLPVDYRQGVLSAEGFVTAPIAGRGSRSMQFFYVNGRTVEDRTMMAALETAYKGLSMQGRFPGCVLNVKMPLEKVDVNVHPAKTEVRFANTAEVFDLVYKAVKSAVTRTDAPQKSLDLSGTAAATAEPLPQTAQLQMPAAAPSIIVPAAAAAAVRTAAPLSGGAPGLLRQDSAVPYETRRSRMLDIEKTPQEDAAAAPPAAEKSAQPLKSQSALQQEAAAAAPTATLAEAPQPLAEAAAQPAPLVYVGEAFRTYIIAERGDELILIDKHAAHERILYEKLVAGYGKVAGQMLLAPVSVTLSAAEKNAVLADARLLCDAGLEIDDFGGASVLVRTVPANVPTESAARLVEEIAARLAAGIRDPRGAKTDWVLHSIACRAAIKGGDHDPAPTLLALAQQILDGVVPPFCPHGRPVLIHLTQKELEKQFGRRE